MVKEVNTTQVDETEVLTDHAYYYDGATGQLSIVLFSTLNDAPFFTLNSVITA